MTTLDQIREQYPQYSDMSDGDLAGALHRKHYADMPRDEFDRKIGLKKNFGIDWNQPLEKVREAISALPEADRDGALEQWADAYVARERKGGGIGMALDNTVRTIARGTFIGEGLDEISAATNAGLHTITGGIMGAPYDETLAYQRARDRAVDRDYGAASVAGRIAGGVAGGGAAWKVAQQGGKALPIALGGPAAFMNPSGGLRSLTAQSAAFAPVYGSTYRFLGAEGGAENRYNEALDRDALGTDVLIGAVAPFAFRAGGAAVNAVSEQTAPLRARIAGQIRDRINPPARPMASGGAAATTPGGGGVASGPDDAANVIIAQQLTRAGVPRGRLVHQLQAADNDAQFYSNSHARNELALADLDPSLAKLAGSAARYQPEAYTRALGFSRARQTGYPEAVLGPDQAGLSVAPRLSVDPTGRRISGQFGRVRDALKRALLISDEEFHGHQRNAYRTGQAIENQAKQLAEESYGAAREAGLAPAAQRAVSNSLDPVAAKWIQISRTEPTEVERYITRTLRNLQRAGGDVGNVHKVKMFLDREIKKQFKENAPSTNRYIGGRLSELRDDIVAAVEGVPRVGALYRQGRERHIVEMRKMEALRLGREVWKQDSEVGIDQYLALTTDDERKLFRLGMFGAFDDQYGGGKARNRDITTVFETPRIQALIGEVIPRSGRAADVFADRNLRFGRYLQNERDMADTPRRVLGNSATAERLADDVQFNQLQGAIEEIMQQPNMIMLGYTAARRAIISLFGYRADTAAAIARKLFDARPEIRRQTIEAIERHMGRDRMELFTRHMDALAQRVSRASSGVAGASQVDE